MAVASGCDWSRVSATDWPLARVKSPSCDTTTCMPEHCLIASSKPFLRSMAGDAPVVPSSSMIFALPPVAVAICTAARLPSWMKSDWITVTKSWPGLAMLWSTSRSSRKTGMPAAPASLTTFAICSVIGAMNRTSGFWAMRPLMSEICLDWSLLASVTVNLMPCLDASSCMLAVSAKRQGLLLAFWLNATLRPDVFVSLGALSAVGTPDGASELPGSAAVASGHAAPPPDPPGAGAFELPLLPPQPASRLTATTATPASGTIFFRSTNPPLGASQHARRGLDRSHKYDDHRYRRHGLR